MKIYSPSQTTAWMHDPLFRWLQYKEGWQPRKLAKVDTAGMVGTAAAAGLAEYNRQRTHSGLIPDAAIASCKANESMRLQLSTVDAVGRVIPDDCPTLREQLVRRALLAVKKGIEMDPIPASWPILGVEMILPDHGNCRLDLAVQTPTGPAPVDYKTKDTLEARYEAFTLSEYEHSWQMLHYAWALSQYLGEPVTRFYICLIVCQPLKRLPVLHPVEIDQELMGLWFNSAKRVWALMEEDDERRGPAWCGWKWYGRWGREPYTDAVLQSRLHKHLMERDYVQVKRSVPSVSISVPILPEVRGGE